jgi:hypothetical protein
MMKTKYSRAEGADEAVMLRDDGGLLKRSK